MDYTIALIPGDGIGPDIVDEGVRILTAVAAKYGHSFTYKTLLAGGAAIDATGKPLPEETLEECKKSDAVLLGAVGGPKWDSVPGNLRPEKALLGLRGGLKVYANLRPAVMFKQLADACPLKKEIVGSGIDILIVRELTGGIYFGERGRNAENTEAWDTELYSVLEIERILRLGFSSAQRRHKRLCVVDKANILETSRLWREVSERIKGDYLDVELSYMYVEITGSIGMLASASLGDGNGPGLYEPIHGSAPDIAGQDKANPLATILSCAMLLRYSLNLDKEAAAVEKAVENVLSDGWRTYDIAGAGIDVVKEAGKLVGTKKMGELVVSALR